MDSETKRQLIDLMAGRLGTTGHFDLAASPATSTTVTRVGISTNSVINLMPRSAAARYADIQNVIPANGSFNVVHTSSASTRTYWYSFHTGGILS